MIPLCQGSHHLYHQINTFAASKDEWDTKDGNSKFMKYTLYNCGMPPQGTSQAEAMEKIKPVALAIIELRLSGKSVICHLVENFIKIFFLKFCGNFSI